MSVTSSWNVTEAPVMYDAIPHQPDPEVVGTFQYTPVRRFSLSREFVHAIYSGRRGIVLQSEINHKET